MLKREDATTLTLSNCRAQAAAEQTAASSGAAAKMVEHFKSSSSYIRSTFAGVFSRVASECGSTSSGYARYYCSDVYGYCASCVLAYTVPSISTMAYCNLYFTAISVLTGLATHRTRPARMFMKLLT